MELLYPTVINAFKSSLIYGSINDGQSTLYDIVNYSKRAPSTVSWHLNRLKNRKLITSTTHDGKPQAYRIINKNAVSRVLSKHTRKFA
jgi:DNA-binding transcriptional ArsR family regulator